MFNLFGKGDATRALKDMLQLQSNSSRDQTQALIPQITSPPIPVTNQLDIGTSGGGQMSFPIRANLKEKRKTTPVQHHASDLMMDPTIVITLGNNSTVELDVKERQAGKLKIFAPSLGSGDVIENTNSNFCRVSRLIDYNWERLDNVNLLTVHRSQPILAYVINVGYSKKVTQNRSATGTSLPGDQAVRIFNYDTQMRGICKEQFVDTITDLAFSYSNEASSNLLAIVDRKANIYVFRFEVSEGLGGLDKSKIQLTLMVTILSDRTSPVQQVHLCWCPFIPSEDESDLDQSFKIAVTTGSHFELFCIERFVGLTNESVYRSALNHSNGEYLSLPDAHTDNIISVALSNDGSAICVACADNMIKFYQMPAPGETKILRNWSPDLGPNQAISYFCFLDDYDFLLTHPEYHYWGYVFMGTKSGLVSIWDLRSQKWDCIQKLEVEIEDDDQPDFTFHVDSSARVILAISKNIAIVLLVEFEERKKANQTSEEENEDVDEVLVPKIVEAARFQLYNPVISFSVRRTNDRYIDIFWVTQKSLERCTIDKESLKELKLVGRNVRSSNNRATKHYDSLINTTAPEVQTVRVQTPLKSTFPNNGTPKVNTPIISKVQTQPIALHTPPAPRPTPNITPVPNSSPFTPVLNAGISKEQELLAKIENATRGLNAARGKRTFDTAPNTSMASPASITGMPLIPDLSQSLMGMSIGSNFHPMNAPILTYTSPLSLPPANFAAIARTQEGIENRISAFEAKMDGQFKEFSQTVSRSIGELSSEIASVRINREELVARDERITEVVVERVVNKSMTELNSIVADGLKDFFEQIRSEVDDLSQSVASSTASVNQSLKEVGVQMSGLTEKIDIFQKQLEKNEAEQQLVYFRLQQQQAMAAALGQSSPFRM